MTYPMLMRDQLQRDLNWFRSRGDRRRDVVRCRMAIALLDVAELVPGEGDVVERVRELKAAHEFDARAGQIASDNADDFCEQLRRAEAELAEARAEQRRTIEGADFLARDLRSKLAALRDAAKRYRNGDRSENQGLDAAIADADEALK